MSRPLVGVVIPTYNRGHQIVDAVESVLAQVDVDVDVVVVDDASTDDTRDVVERRLADWSPRVRYIAAPKGERSRARNLGLRAVRGDLVAFLDSDDVWEPSHLSDAVEALAGSDALASVSEYGLASPDLEVLVDRVERPFVDHVDLLAALCRKQIIIQPSEVVIRRAALPEDPFDPDVPGAEDWVLWVQLALRGRLVATRRRSAWLRISRDGTFGSPGPFTASLLLAGEKVIASGAPAAAGVAPAEVRAVCRMNGSYAHVLNGHRARGLQLLASAATARPAILVTPSWWAAAGRALVPLSLAHAVRRRRRPGTGRRVPEGTDATGLD